MNINKFFHNNDKGQKRSSEYDSLTLAEMVARTIARQHPDADNN